MPKVLVVDDEPSIRVLISEILVRKGYEVFKAADAVEALEIIRRESPEVAIVDLVMPGVGGMTLIMEKLRSIPGLAIVAMSGRIPLGTEAFSSFSEQFGVACFLQKPFTVQELLLAMGQALKGACVISGS